MSYAIVITMTIDLPQAHNHIEAELYGKNYADKIRQESEDLLLECELEEVVEYEVDE